MEHHYRWWKEWDEEDENPWPEEDFYGFPEDDGEGFWPLEDMY